MDPVRVTVGALGLVEGLDKLIKFCRDEGLNVQEGVDDDVFGELLILLNVVVESKMILDELSNRPPSLIIALKRCQEKEKRLKNILHASISKKAKFSLKKTLLVLKQDELRDAVTAFKSSVLLFRNIATE